MKKTFLFLSSLALLAVSASASAETASAEIPTLPAFVVTVDRETELERSISASLDRLRAAADVAPVITARPRLPATVIADQAAQKREKAMAEKAAPRPGTDKA